MKTLKFSAEFIPMIQDGTKTETRRPLDKLKGLVIGDVVQVCDSDGVPVEGLTIGINRIKQQRLSEMSMFNMKAEGFMTDEELTVAFRSPTNSPESRRLMLETHRRFLLAWQKFYGPNSYTINPVVWVIEFEKL